MAYDMNLWANPRWFAEIPAWRQLIRNSPRDSQPNTNGHNQLHSTDDVWAWFYGDFTSEVEADEDENISRRSSRFALEAPRRLRIHEPATGEMDSSRAFIESLEE